MLPRCVSLLMIQIVEILSETILCTLEEVKVARLRFVFHPTENRARNLVCFRFYSSS